MAYSTFTVTPRRPRLGRVGSTAFTTPFSSLLQQLPSQGPTPPPGQWFTNYQANNPAPRFTGFLASSGGFSGLQAGGPIAGPGGAPMGGGGGGVSLPSGAGLDYSNDPIFQQAQAAVQAQIKAAEAQAQAARNTNYIRYGDPDLARQGGASNEAIEAARNNAFGTVPELNRWNDRSLSSIDTARSSQNLFYSSTRARDRALQQEDLIRQKTTTGNQLQDTITQIAQGLLAQKQQAQMSLLSVAEAAYGRALQMAMFNAQMAAMQPYPAYPGAPTSPASAASPPSYNAPSVQAAKAAVGYGSSIPWTAGL